jgi:hypothetical protein
MIKRLKMNTAAPAAVFLKSRFAALKPGRDKTLYLAESRISCKRNFLAAAG